MREAPCAASAFGRASAFSRPFSTQSSQRQSRDSQSPGTPFMCFIVPPLCRISGIPVSRNPGFRIPNPRHPSMPPSEGGGVKRRGEYSVRRSWKNAEAAGTRRPTGVLRGRIGSAAENHAPPLASVRRYDNTTTRRPFGGRCTDGRWKTIGNGQPWPPPSPSRVAPADSTRSCRRNNGADVRPEDRENLPTSRGDSRWARPLRRRGVYRPCPCL